MTLFLRLSKSINIFLVCVNIVVCVVLLRVYFLSSNNKSPLDEYMETKVKEGLGMDAFCVKNPFGVFVDKDYAHNNNFYFCQNDEHNIFLKQSDVRINKTDAKYIVFNLGSDPYICLSCFYSDKHGFQILDIQLNRDNIMYMDFNSEGRFNTRTILPIKEQFRRDVWYNRNWCEVDLVKSDGMDMHQQVLKENGELVIYDNQIGQWIPKTDNVGVESPKPDAPENKDKK